MKLKIKNRQGSQESHLFLHSLYSIRVWRFKNKVSKLDWLSISPLEFIDSQDSQGFLIILLGSSRGSPVSVGDEINGI